jgi:hypothetical protein
VEFEVLGSHRDLDGAEYLSCFDPKNVYVEVRLYLRKEDKDLYKEGDLIKGDIGSWKAYPGINKGYYKISPWTVSHAGTKPEHEPALFPTHKGSFLPKTEWEKQYKDCAWCTTPLLAEDDNEFTTGGQCLCPACAKDAAVAEQAGITLLH